MRRRLAPFSGFVLVLLGLCAAAARPDDGIPPDTLAAVKHATVFVRVQWPAGKATGSGFVAAADKDGVLVATNYHVVAPPDYEKKPRPAPADLLKSLKGPTVTAVFDGGTKAEASAPAEVIAADPENDLAVLRVTGLKDRPKPIDYADPPKLSETMPVYTFGFPFGQALATGRGAPSVTVGKGSVSSLRLDDDGRLAVVQIDGSLNPGNSGGPVVDSKGRLVGVAVATIRNGQGIGFAVPCPELGRLMKGRLDGFRVTAAKGADGKLTARAEVGVLDPTAAVRGVTLHYVVVPPKGERPKPGEPLEKHPGARKVALKVAGGVASGDAPLDAGEGELFVQAVPDGGAGADGASRVRGFPISLPKGGGEVVLGSGGAAGVSPGVGAGEGTAPAGWKEYTATNRTYKAWFPERASVAEKQRVSGKPPGARLSFNSAVAELPGGTVYAVEQIIITPPRAAANRDEIMKLLKAVALGDAPGAKVTREADAKMGRFPGTEYLVEAGNAATRARGFVIGSSVYLLRVVGTRDAVESADAATFLDSCRLQVITRPAGESGGVIAGGRNDPEFRDPVPAGGVLVGLELGLGKLGANNVVKAARAVFRVGDKETTGEWHGPAGGDAVKETTRVVAKPGYALAGMAVRTGPGVYGLSVTFMKVAADGRLDPKDAYESAFVGTGLGLGPVKIGGTGEPAVALIGKSNADAVSGLGLRYKDTRPVNRGPRIQGGGGPEFKDIGPAGSLLVGLEVSLGKFFDNDVVAGVRPVYRVGDKESAGGLYGTDTGRVVKVVAKPGYAVGAIAAKTGLGMDGLSVTFMKVGGDGRLDPKDGYESEWVGGKGGDGPVKMGGDGTPVVGLLGRTNQTNVSALGPAYLGEKPWPPGKPTEVRGGGDFEHRDGAPAGGLLVGFEVGLGKFFDKDIVVALRPVYRVGDKESLGEQYGTNTARVVKVVAKPGYAVGGVTVKTGLGIDGLSVTYMKVTDDGKLDPKDNSESEWLGGAGGGGLVRITGGGTPVVGVVARANAKDVTGVGLLLQEPGKK